MVARLATVFLLLSSVTGSFAYEGQLAADDECRDGECALNALQKRETALELRKVHEHNAENAEGEDEVVADESIQEGEGEQWGSILGITTEKCCRCKNGLQGWSASGTCSFCRGMVAKTKSVPSGCVVGNKGFKGNMVCANQCKGQLASWFLQEETDENTEGEDEVVADESIQEGEGEQWGSILGITTEKCCRCKNGLPASPSDGRDLTSPALTQSKKLVPPMQQFSCLQGMGLRL